MNFAAGTKPRLSSATAGAETAAAARAAKTRSLLDGPIGPTLARLSAPNVLAMVVTAATTIAEGLYAGILGVSALAGLAVVFPLVMLTQMLSAGSIGGAVSSAVARALGAGDVARAERLILHAGVIAVLAAFGSAILVAFFGPALFRLLGGEGDALAAAVAYAGVFFPGCIAIWLCHTTLSIIRGTGNMGVPSLVLLLVSLGSIPISGALAFGWGPFPALGMRGLAGGLVTAFTLGAVASLAYIGAGAIGLGLRRAWGRLKGALFWDILKVGLLASASALQTVLTIVVMVGLVGRFGEAALAGYGLGTRLEFLMIPIVFGIGAAMTAMVGANIGAGQRRRALAIAWTGAFGAAAIVGGIGIVFAVFPDLWLGIFLTPSEAADAGAFEAGRTYFRIAAPFYALFALGLALYFACQGAGKVLWPVVGGFIRMAVAVGGGFLLTDWLGLGLEGVFAAVAAGLAIYGVFTAAAVRLSGWR